MWKEVIKYVKRSKYSFHDFSAKHTPSATLIVSQYFFLFTCGVHSNLTLLYKNKNMLFVADGQMYNDQVNGTKF